MADGRRLAFEDSRKLGVTCKAHQLTSVLVKKISTMDFTNLVTLEVVTIVGEAIAKNGNLSVRSSGEKKPTGIKNERN